MLCLQKGQEIRNTSKQASCATFIWAWWHMFFLCLFSVRSLNDLVHSGHCSLVYIWCPPPLEFSCRVSAWHCTNPAPECFQGIVRNQREHVVTAGENSFRWTCLAWCFPIQGTMHFNFQVHLTYSMTLTTWWCAGLICSFSEHANEMG